jgi:hypothetical protein
LVRARTLIEELNQDLSRNHSRNQSGWVNTWERVDLAVLTLAEGDIVQLAKDCEAARRDWRDVIWWANPKYDGAKTWEEVKSKLAPHLPPGTLEDRPDHS